MSASKHKDKLNDNGGSIKQHESDDNKNDSIVKPLPLHTLQNCRLTFVDADIPNYHLIARNILNEIDNNILLTDIDEHKLRHPTAPEGVQPTTWEALTSLRPNEPIDTCVLDHYLQCVKNTGGCPDIITTHELLNAAKANLPFYNTFNDIRLVAMVAGIKDIRHYGLAIIFPPRASPKKGKYTKKYVVMDPDPGYMGKKVSTEFRDQLRNGGFIDKQYKLLQFDLLRLGWTGQKRVEKIWIVVCI